MPKHVALALLAVVLLARESQAQTLDLRSRRVAELRRGTQFQNGEVTLGETSLQSALRMFAVELGEAVSMPRGNPGNPSLYPAGTEWQVGSYKVQPYKRLELGPERYTLSFDRNERLIVASTEKVDEGLTQAVLLERYPGLEKESWSQRGDQPLNFWSAKLESCVSLSARTNAASGVVENLSYIYTCKTKH
jgi:hypothetical protein